jgi:large subunit ribosomal protein L31e
MVRVKIGEKRKYIIPLRKEWLKVPRWRRSKRAIDALQNYVQKHTKVNNVRISTWLNEAVWKHGGKNPPAKVEVEVTIENRKVQDKKTKKDVDTPFAIAELATIPKRVTRHIKKTEEKTKKFKKEASTVQTSGKDPKALAESLKKKLAEKKGNKKEDKPSKAKTLRGNAEQSSALKVEKKKVAPKITKEQDISMQK